MPRGVPHVFQIVVFSADSEAFCCGCGATVEALLRSGEYALELDHSHVCREESRPLWESATTRQTCMVPFLKVLEEHPAQF